MTNVALALVLILAALGVIFYLVVLVFGSLRPRVLFERLLFRRHVLHARAGDRLLDEGDLAAALTRYRRAFYPFAASGRDLADDVRRHHTALLSRLLAAADQVDPRGTVRLISLARADRLLRQRDALQRRYLAARATGKGVRTVERELRTNTEQVRAALASLAEEIATVPDEPTH